MRWRTDRRLIIRFFPTIIESHMARTFNPFDGPRKPFAGADDPEAEGIDEDDTECD